jgi:hypothetical protein
MKKLLLVIFVITQLANAQDTKFELTPEKFTDYVVVPFEGKSQSDIYKKTLQWIEYTYKNPKEVLKSNIENEYIRFEGVKDGLYSIQIRKKKYSYLTRYAIEISFKEGKAKFDVTNTEFYLPTSTPATSAGWNKIDLDNSSYIFEKFEKGELKSAFINFKDIPSHFNTLVDSFTEFVKSDTIPSKKSDW